MARTVQDRQDGFLGGLNLVADENQLEINEVRLAENGHVTTFGAIKKRQGTRYILSAPFGAGAAVKAGYTWERATAASQILAVWNGHLLTATYAIPASFTDQGAVLSTSTTPSLVTFRNAGGECVFIADGGLLNSWDGTTFLPDIASTPSVARLWVYNQRLFGISGNNETIFWSALNNGATLGIAASGGGSAVIRTFGDQSVTMGVSGEGALFLFHISGISLFRGWTQDDINISAGTNGLTQDLGTTAWRAVVPLENAVLFVSDRGVFKLNLNGTAPVGVKVNSAFAALSGTDLALVTAVHCKLRQEVWFNVPNYGILAYSYRLETWSGPFTGVNVGITCIFEGLDAAGAPIVLAGTSDGWIKRLDMPGSFKDSVLSDGTSGSVYNLNVKLHRMFFGDPWMEKSLRWLHMLVALGGSGAAYLQWVTEHASGTYFFPVGSDVWSSDPLDIWDGLGVWGGIGIESLDVPAHGTGTRLDLTFVDSSEAEASLSGARATAFPVARR